jgi:hypothetical protein
MDIKWTPLKILMFPVLGVHLRNCRSAILADATTALQRIKSARAAQSLILVGLRGVGKTVLLVKVKEIAEHEGFKTALIEAQENKSLAALLLPSLRSILYSLDVIESAKDKARKGLRVLKSFVGALKVSLSDIEYGLSINPEKAPNFIHSIREQSNAETYSAYIR